MRIETINEIKRKRNCDVVSGRRLEAHAVGEERLARPGRRDQDRRTDDFLDGPERHGVDDVQRLDREAGLHLEREAHRLEELRGLLLAEAVQQLAREERAEDGGRRAALLRREVRVPRRRAQAVALPRNDLAEDLAPRAQLAQPLDGAPASFVEPRGT